MYVVVRDIQRESFTKLSTLPWALSVPSESFTCCSVSIDSYSLKSLKLTEAVYVKFMCEHRVLKSPESDPSLTLVWLSGKLMHEHRGLKPESITYFDEPSIIC